MSSLPIVGESPDFASSLPPCAVSPGGDEISGFSMSLRISVLFRLKAAKLYVMACPRQLIGTTLLKMTTDNNFGNYHKQLL